MPLASFLNGGTATQLRGLLWLSLSDTGTVGTRTSTSDSGGGASETWAYGASIPCRVDPIASSGDDETIVASRLSDRSTHLITTPPGTVAGIANRFAIANGGTYEITAVRDRTAQTAKFLEAVQVS